MKQKLAFAENSLLFMRKVINDADTEADSCHSLNIRENHSVYIVAITISFIDRVLRWWLLGN